jgi:hypothetical protein
MRELLRISTNADLEANKNRCGGVHRDREYRSVQLGVGNGGAQFLEAPQRRAGFGCVDDDS